MSFKPKTKLGKTLLKLRKRYIRNGGKLMSAKEIKQMIKGEQ